MTFSILELKISNKKSKKIISGKCDNCSVLFEKRYSIRYISKIKERGWVSCSRSCGTTLMHIHLDEQEKIKRTKKGNIKRKIWWQSLTHKKKKKKNMLKNA